MIAIAFISNGDGLSLSLLKRPSWENKEAIQNPAALHSSTLLSRVTDKNIPPGNCQIVFSVVLNIFSVWPVLRWSWAATSPTISSLTTCHQVISLVISFKPEEIIIHFYFRLVCGRFLDQFCCSSWGHSWKNGKKYDYFFSVSMIFDIFHPWMFSEK